MRHAILLSLLASVVVLAPAAAKGPPPPHASVASGPAGIDPGKPWVTTLTLVGEGGREAVAARPRVILRSGSTRFAVSPRPILLNVPERRHLVPTGSYRLRVVFPHAGRWTYTVLDGTRANRRYRFPAATIGGDERRAPAGVVAFDALPPAVVPSRDDASEDGRSALWIPAAGLTLAGVGTLAALRRRRG